MDNSVLSSFAVKAHHIRMRRWLVRVVLLDATPNQLLTVLKVALVCASGMVQYIFMDLSHRGHRLNSNFSTANLSCLTARQELKAHANLFEQRTQSVRSRKTMQKQRKLISHPQQAMQQVDHTICTSLRTTR